MLQRSPASSCLSWPGAPIRSRLRALPLLLALLFAAAARAAPLDQETPADVRVTPVVRVVRDVGPAVVNVYQEVVKEVDWPPPWNRIYGPQRTRNSSLGSGFVIDTEGYILTNAHVIQENSQGQGILVKLADETTYPAELVSVDTDNDVALLRIRPAPDHVLVAAPIGTSSDLMVGESVIAIGNPLGNRNSVSTGIVSSMFRDVRVPAGNSRTHLSPAFKDFIQIDAPINPGNSGGPLLNMLGQVIGINFAIAAEAQGIGFAIPIDRVRKSLIGNLLNPRLHREVVTGLEIEGDSSGHHVVLAAVTPNGPAAEAGLQPGDELLSVLGQPIAWEFDYNKALLATRPGDKVPVVVRRAGRTISTEVELARDESPLLYIWRTMGMAVVDHPRYKGVRVERVDPAGPASQLGIQAGDLVDGIGELALDSSMDLYTAVREQAPGDRITIHVWRGGTASSGPLLLR